jgi:hypothetical protein
MEMAIRAQMNGIFCAKLDLNYKMSCQTRLGNSPPDRFYFMKSNILNSRGSIISFKENFIVYHLLKEEIVFRFEIIADLCNILRHCSDGGENASTFILL